MWNFSWCTSLCPAKQQDEGGDGQFLSFERAGKVRNCRFLHICGHVSLSTYLCITWPSCDVSGRIDFIFGLLVGRLAPAFSDAEILALLWIVLVAKWRITGKKAQNVENSLFQRAVGEVFIEMWISALSSRGRSVYWNVEFFLVHFPMSS